MATTVERERSDVRAAVRPSGMAAAVAVRPLASVRAPQTRATKATARAFERSARIALGALIAFFLPVLAWLPLWKLDVPFEALLVLRAGVAAVVLAPLAVVARRDAWLSLLAGFSVPYIAFAIAMGARAKPAYFPELTVAFLLACSVLVQLTSYSLRRLTDRSDEASPIAQLPA